MTFEEAKNKLLLDKKVKEEYDKLKSEYEKTKEEYRKHNRNT